MTETQSLMDATQLKTYLDQKLGGKYETYVTQDRWNISLSGQRNCVIVKKSPFIGVAVSPDAKKQKIEVFGCAPNQVFDQMFTKGFGFIGKLLLSQTWVGMEQEVARALPRGMAE